MAHLQPDIGSWFENIESGELFEVVAIDELEQTVEVQYLDGSLGEFELNQWRGLPVISAVPPEDANIAYGMTVLEQDPGAIGGDTPDQANPLDTMEGESFPGTDESPF